MNKKDILKSFSKVHNRQLRLLEQEEEEIEQTPDQASFEQRKQSAIVALKQMSWTMITPSRFESPDPSGKSKVPFAYTQGAGKTPKFLGPSTRAQSASTDVLVDEAGNFNIQNLVTLAENPDAKNGPEALTNFIGALVGDYKSNTQKKEEARTEAGAKLDSLDDQVFKDDQEKEKVRMNLQAIGENIGDIWPKMTEKQQEAYGNTFDVYKRFFVGDRQESFESRLLSSKVALQLKDGEWVAQPAAANAQQSILISQTLKELTDFLIRDNVTDLEKECSKILKDFAIQLGGTPRLIISPAGHGTERQTALSFADDKHTLTNLVRMAANKCRPGKTEESDQLIAKVNVRESDGDVGTNDNAIRGFMFEEILEVFSLYNIKRARGAGMETVSDDLDVLLTRKTRKIIDRLQRLKDSSEEWVNRYLTETALPPEEVELIRSIRDVATGIGETLGDFEPYSLFGSMLQHSKLSLQERNPAYIFPVGTETKKGKRQDVLEIYRTREEAIAAAQKMGVNLEPEEHANLNSALRDAEGVVREEGGGVNLATILENERAFAPNQPVYTIKVSLKNYKKLAGEGAVMGGGRRATMSDLGKRERGEYSEPFMRKIAEIANITNPRAFKRYALKYDKIEKSIDALGDKATLVTKTGGIRIQKDSLKTLIDTVNKKLRDAAFDLNDDSKELKRILENIRKDSEAVPSNADANFSKAKEYVKRFLQMKMLNADLKVSNPKERKLAQQVIATTMLHGGGSDDDELLCDYRGLNNNEKYVFKQNEPFKEAWGSVLADDGNWKLVPSEGGYHLVLASNPKVSIRMNYGINATKSEGQISSWYSAATVTLGTQALKYFNRYNRTTSESKVSEAFRHIMLALSLLQEKVSIADSQ